MEKEAAGKIKKNDRRENKQEKGKMYSNGDVTGSVCHWSRGLILFMLFSLSFSLEVGRTIFPDLSEQCTEQF